MMVMWLKIFELTMVLFSVFYGSIINAGFIGSFYVNPSLKKKDSAYLRALGFADLTITLVVMPIISVFMILKIELPREGCHIIQLCTEITTKSYSFLTMMVAADNYFSAHPECRLSSAFKDISTSLIIPTIVLVSTIIALTGIYGELHFNYCNIEEHGDLRFRVAENIFVYILPAVISLVAFVITAKKARTQTNQLQNHLNLAITNINIIAYLFYIICWIPDVVVIYTNPESFVLKYVIWIGLMRSALGNTFYVLLNNHVRKGFTAIFRFVCCLPIETLPEELPLQELPPRPTEGPQREEVEM